MGNVERIGEISKMPLLEAALPSKLWSAAWGCYWISLKCKMKALRPGMPLTSFVWYVS